MEGRALRYVAAVSVVVAAVIVVVLVILGPSGASISVSDVQVSPYTPGSLNTTCVPAPCTPAPDTSGDYYLSFLVSGAGNRTVHCTATVVWRGHQLAKRTVVTRPGRGFPTSGWFDTISLHVPGVSLQASNVSVDCR